MGVAALKSKLKLDPLHFYSVPVSGYIINYNLTRPSGGIGSGKRPLNDMLAFDKFSKVKFAYGLAKGGMHTFLLSYGMVY